MKLYTEKEIEAIGQWATQWDLYELDKEINIKPPMFKEFIESLTPIELPSDDEIARVGLDFSVGYNVEYWNGFKHCGEWIKEQILNQNIPELRNADGTYGSWGTSGINNQNK